MKITFRPFPGLTIITLIMLAILIWLGTWQYHRLQWKTALLAEVEQSVTAPPVTSFADIISAIENNESVDFRRAQIDGQSLAFEEPFRVFTGANRDVSWRLYSPVTHNGVTAFAARNVITDKTDIPSIEAGPDTLTGYVRVAREANNAKVKSTPGKNRWFGFNTMPDSHNWSDQVDGGADMRFYIDAAQGATDASLLPPKRPDIRNNHFDYMLTWYGLAIVLLIIYGILHIREGRLEWR